jgi:glycosidase
MLRKPIEECPDSLEGQLDLVRREWEAFLPEVFQERLRVTRGILKEETQMRGHGPGPVEVLHFGPGAGADAAHDYPEVEAFSQDTAWMPNVVLIAKSTYVWLDQLSKRFHRPVNRLDEIPDEALDELARWGFTGLWLIGLWERSVASRDIKRRMGNPEAEASAYSLYDYTIAMDLGGQPAYETLKARAWQRGIRLASDMVPNHVGIYSKWVIEHPDWFIQSGHPPFPGYRFDGPNLSYDDRVELRIENGYWDHSDAAVVFQRIDRWSGDTRYIYHGNDGTSMPWNDTAQLNFMNEEVREAVAQTILHVARMFPIIRFDAAMTLAKKHYQRLWFPKPGDEGAIPSRAEHGMSRHDFDTVFPKEFWREVVDRVGREVPDTLLLAEAFWLMEGYFVRTLGMHRVYNSAFMNMLKMEENSKYRQTIKNVLEFSPEVLQRFVNFMNNPDEDTAEAQFGTGDKYFGVAVLLSTMPGLPMYGHGQVEGFTEKYGMEYRRAYKDESIDWDLVHRHEWEIFPLVRKRYLFSGAKEFALFDFHAGGGWVDENVYAYSNRSGSERALIVYNNAYESTDGTVHTSTAINVGSSEEPHLVHRTLAEALALNLADTCYYIYHDQRTGLEYLEHAQRIAHYGLHLHLHGYQYYAFLDWQEVHDLDNSWGRLHGILAGRGVPSVREAYLEMQLAFVLEPFRTFMTAEYLQTLFDPKAKKDAREAAGEAYTTYLEAVSTMVEDPATTPDKIWRKAAKELKCALTLSKCLDKVEWPKDVTKYLTTTTDTTPPAETIQHVAVLVALMRHMGGVKVQPKEAKGLDTLRLNDTAAAWMHDWMLVKPIAAALEAYGASHEDAWQQARLVRICVSHVPDLRALETEVWGPLLDRFFGDADVRQFLQVHYFGGRHWMNREQLERLLYMVYRCLAVAWIPAGEDAVDPLLWARDNIQTLLEAAEDVGYDFDRFNEVLR